MTWRERLLAVPAVFWAWLRDVATVARPCRFSAFIVLAGALLLLSPQGRELTVRLPSESLWKVFWFDACVFLWAFQSWYWARVILDMTFGPDRGASLVHPRHDRIRRLIVRTPRVIAVSSYIVAVAASCLAGWAAWKIALALLVQGVLFVVLLVWRTTLVKKIMAGAAADASSWKRRMLREGDADPSSLRSLPLLSRAIIHASLALAAVLTAWVCWDAVGFGWFFGAAAVPFLGFSMLVPVGSLLVLWTREGGAQQSESGSARQLDTARGYPVVLTLIAIAVVFSLFPSLDNHKVRTLADAKPAGKAVDQVLDEWYAQAPRLKDKRSNLVVVAAAGGGLRAAYWTTTVLGMVQDNSADFRRQLVGISGVSGGSLGATVFVTLLGREPVPMTTAGCSNEIGPYECAGQAVLSQDFLGPTVAALLFPDLMQRFVPLGFPDRAKALEQSWERAWKRAGFEDGLWRDRGFRALWGGAFLPALLLNGTHVESGKRVITSNIDVAGSPAAFRDAYDFYKLVPSGMEIRPSTAAHNSARFTYVSPASTLGDGTHLVDGGYFENYGAVTAHELLQAGMRRFRGKIRPIVILISNDPKLEAEELPSRPPSIPAPAKPQSWAGEVLSPLRALLHTRDARGLLAASELRELAELRDGKYFQFRLCSDPERPAPALGWVLSKDAENLMREQLRSDACGNAEQFRLLLETLAGR
jgi:hypothetical protein